MELNKIVSAILLAGIVGMGSAFVANLLIHPEVPDEFAYVIEVPEAEGEGEAAAAEEEPQLAAIAPLMAAADASAGEAASRACAACHSFEQGGAHKIGPNLWNVVMGPMAHAEDFSYSDALQARADEGGVWTYENLNAFLHAPRDWLPGTSMSYAGLSDAEDRANMIAYLRSLSEEPPPLPDPEGDGTDTAEAEAPAETATGG